MPEPEDSSESTSEPCASPESLAPDGVTGPNEAPGIEAASSPLPGVQSSALDLEDHEGMAPQPRGRQRIRRRRRWWLISLGLLLVGVLGTGGVLVATGPRVAPGEFHALTALGSTTPGTPPQVTWPVMGQGAWSIPVFDVAGASPGQVAIPIGSTAKMMTALVIIEDHPLQPGVSGPAVTVTAEDRAAYAFEAQDGQSNVAVEVGERLSELQLLQGLLVHSANDYALMLARWDAGSETAFVAKMNHRATELGLGTTHYADASGYNPGTVSTAADQLVVATALVASPVLASIVNMPSVVLPVAGSVGSYTPLLGVSGVVGVKSGLTSQAGGCDVMAYVSMHGGFPVMILTAVMGQVFSIDRLSTAGSEALRLAHETEVGLVPITALGDREKVGELTFASGSTGVVAARSVVVPSWPGNNVGVSLQMTRTVRGEVPAGSVIGRARVDSGAFHLSVPLVTARRIPGLSLWQRLV